jgi:iron complex transport system permease protein
MNSAFHWPRDYGRRLAVILLLTPPVVVGSVFLGSGWREPWALLRPENSAVWSIRCWRVGLGATLGMALAVAGSLLQAVLRNPLAEPYVLGLSSGAALGVALAIAAGVTSAAALPLAGFIGALVSLCAVLLLARIRNRTVPSTLILAGVVWSSLCGSALMFLVSQSSAEGMHAVMWWFLGDLQVFDRALARVVMGICAAAALVVVPRLRRVNAMLLGDEAATGLGLRPELERAWLLALASLLAAAAVAASGLISFVGLTAPHVARALVGSDHRRLVPAAACLGAAFLTLADGIGRTLLYPIEVPAGVITAMVGAPFFLWLLRRHAREIWS